jgi:hypothetical protein
MGMANISNDKPEPFWPVQKGNILCECGSQYNPKTKWIRVVDRNGPYSTANPDYIKVGDIPLGACPSCRRLNKPEEKEDDE